MSGYNRRLLRHPVLVDANVARLHGEANQAVNAILDGRNDLVFEEPAGVILQDTAGQYWRVSIQTDGALVTTSLGTDRP